MRSAGLVLVLIMLLATSALGAEFQWPSQMSIGGFQITDIRGTVNPDGSGSATGTLQVPNTGSTSVTLLRSARGDITGTTSINAGKIRGSFTLSSSGLRGQGTVDCPPRRIVNASIAVSPRGDASGSGRLELGRLAVSVDFTVYGSSCSFRSTSPARVRAQVDTAVASYSFEGNLTVRCEGGRVSATVSGRVERTSKVGNQVSSFDIPNTSVDLSNGQCTVNVGGVNITFSLF